MDAIDLRRSAERSRNAGASFAPTGNVVKDKTGLTPSRLVEFATAAWTPTARHAHPRVAKEDYGLGAVTGWCPSTSSIGPTISTKHVGFDGSHRDESHRLYGQATKLL